MALLHTAPASAWISARLRRTARPWLRALTVFATLAAAPSIGWAQDTRYAVAGESSRYAEAGWQAHQLAQSLLREAGLPGLSVAVAVDGRIVYSEGFGYANVENRVPVTPLTRMRIGSVSKSVTSAALGLLYERGKLDFDAPIQRYVPDFPEKRWPITVRQVAGHIAGIRHYRGNEMESSRHYDSVTESLEIFADDSLLFEPGTKYSYSSYGWNLLSAVIESAAGENFLTFMREEVFEPLGLRSIVAEHTDSILEWRASFYERDSNDVLHPAPYVDNSYKWAGGGFISNTEDLVRYGSALLRPGFLKPATVALLFTSQHLASGGETHYGMGWGSSTDENGRRIISHTGGSVGGRAVLVLYPDQHVVVALLSNAGHAPMSVANGRKFGELFLPPS